MFKILENKHLFFLPENISTTYPNLNALSAELCSIKEISKLNFHGLKELKSLWITGNPLQRIASNTFEDLESLERLYLCKISFIKLLIILRI